MVNEAKHFLESHPILIADPDSASAQVLESTLKQICPTAGKIEIAPDLERATLFLEKQKPLFVISEYELGSHRGTDLRRIFRKIHPQLDGNIFGITTSRTDQCTVARLAEAEVDFVILKPFLSHTLSQTLQERISKKLLLTKYLKNLEQSQLLYKEGKSKESIHLLEKMKKDQPNLAMARGFLGEAYRGADNMDRARSEFDSVLKGNPAHFRSLLGRYEMSLAEQEHAESLKCLQNFLNHYPILSERTGSFARLRILGDPPVPDIEPYVKQLLSIARDRVDIINYVAPAAIVFGKYLLALKQKADALKLFGLALLSPERNTEHRLEVIRSLCENKLATEALNFLKTAPPEFIKSPKFTEIANLIKKMSTKLGA